MSENKILTKIHERAMDEINETLIRLQDETVAMIKGAVVGADQIYLRSDVIDILVEALMEDAGHHKHCFV